MVLPVESCEAVKVEVEEVFVKHTEEMGYQILSKCQKFFLFKTKTNTYSVSELKDKNRHGPSK